MTDMVISIILLAIVGLAARYVYRAKKSGAKCIGCPAAGSCCSCGKNACSAEEKK